VLTGCLSLGRRPGDDWGEYVTLNKRFYSLIFKQEVVAAPSYCHSFFLIAFLEAFIGNVIIILYINYIIIICIIDNNTNNSVINNNRGRFPDLTLLFQIPMGS